jgi:Holliday junction resolvasome RuvABC endonuclease subunit
VQGESVTGLDCSTKSIAFCKMERGVPVHWGEVFLNGADLGERIYDAKVKTASLSDKLRSDAVALEAAIFVQSPDTAISLAYVYGAVLGELLGDNKHVARITPTTWQYEIGNGRFSRQDKEDLMARFPGHAKSWYDTQQRKIRKQRTMDWVFSTYGIRVVSDNVGDAFGLAYYADRKLLDYE